MFMVRSFLSFFFIFHSLNVFSHDVINKGFRLPLDLIESNFRLLDKEAEAIYLAKYIVKANYKIAKEESVLIARTISKVSSCLEIDPWLLTGLIQKESSFIRGAVSPTGAAGLTQFTNIAIKEVHDQLGMRGKTGAPEAVIFYFNEQIQKCINSNWVHLWLSIGVEENTPEFYPLLKEKLKTDVEAAVTYGALLLKVYLAFVKSKNLTENVDMELGEMYFHALQIYNGEEGEARVRYARNVFKNVKNAYPDPIEFPY